jgi:hypothetical protein
MTHGDEATERTQHQQDTITHASWQSDCIVRMNIHTAAVSNCPMQGLVAKLPSMSPAVNPSKTQMLSCQYIYQQQCGARSFPAISHSVCRGETGLWTASRRLETSQDAPQPHVAHDCPENPAATQHNGCRGAPEPNHALLEGRSQVHACDARGRR